LQIPTKLTEDGLLHGPYLASAGNLAMSRRPVLVPLLSLPRPCPLSVFPSQRQPPFSASPAPPPSRNHSPCRRRQGELLHGLLLSLRLLPLAASTPPPIFLHPIFSVQPLSFRVSRIDVPPPLSNPSIRSISTVTNASSLNSLYALILPFVGGPLSSRTAQLRPQPPLCHALLAG
jgi:hypothetical protein